MHAKFSCVQRANSQKLDAKSKDQFAVIDDGVSYHYFLKSSFIVTSDFVKVDFFVIR